jgi:hypothetical protein
MVWRLLIIEGLGAYMYPLDATLMGLDTINGPKAKNGGATPRQILLTFPKTPRMPELDVVCDLIISFNVDNSWTSWTLYIVIVSAVLVESNFSWTLDRWH